MRKSTEVHISRLATENEVLSSVTGCLSSNLIHLTKGGQYVSAMRDARVSVPHLARLNAMIETITDNDDVGRLRYDDFSGAADQRLLTESAGFSRCLSAKYSRYLRTSSLTRATSQFMTSATTVAALSAASNPIVAVHPAPTRRNIRSVRVSGCSCCAAILRSETFISG